MTRFLPVALTAFLCAAAPAFAECEPQFRQLLKQGAATPKATKVNIVVMFGFHDGLSLDVNGANIQADRYNEENPGERSVVIAPDSVADLKNRIAKVLKPGELVHHLFLDSHAEKVGLYYGVFVLEVHKTLERIRAPEELSDVFAGIKGRFSPDAAVVFSACNVLGDDDFENQAILLGVMDKLGMKTGRVFGSNNTVTNVMDDIANQKYSAQCDWKSKLIVGGTTVILPLTYAFSGVADYLISNRGYTYVRLGEKDFCIGKAHFMDARHY